MAKILLIDDDEAFIELTKQRLERSGHHVTTQKSAFGASLPLQKGDFDLLLLDVNMPGLSGRTFLKVLKDKNLLQLKIVLYSSIDQDSLRKIAVEEGVDGFLSKSASREELLRKVDRVLSQSTK